MTTTLTKATNEMYSNQMENLNMMNFGVIPATTQMQPAANQSSIVISNGKLDLKASLNSAKANASAWYQASTKMLYNVLGQCYEIYYRIETAPTDERDTLLDELKQAYAELDGNQNANKTTTRIVSVVFNFADIDRKTRSRYARVITKAFKDKNKPTCFESFAQWVITKGGVIKALEVIKVDDKNTFTQADVNRAVRQFTSLATVSNIPNSGNRLVVLLANPVDGNTVEILHASEDKRISDELARKAKKLADDAKNKEQTEAESAEAVTETVMNEQFSKEGK